MPLNVRVSTYFVCYIDTLPDPVEHAHFAISPGHLCSSVLVSRFLTLSLNINYPVPRTITSKK